MADLWFKTGTEEVVINGSDEVIECAGCPCDDVVGCANCDTDTAQSQYTITFGGSTAAATCASGDCDDLIGAFVVTSTGDTTCLWSYTGTLSGCLQNYEISLDFTDAVATGYIQVAIAISGLTHARFRKAWTLDPTVDCSSSEVTGSYALFDNPNSAYCDLTSVTCSVAL